jgi:hypothetical protein
VRATDNEKDDVPSESVVVLIRIKSFEDMQLQFVMQHFRGAQFRQRCYNGKC